MIETVIEISIFGLSIGLLIAQTFDYLWKKFKKHAPNFALLAIIFSSISFGSFLLLYNSFVPPKKNFDKELAKYRELKKIEDEKLLAEKLYKRNKSILAIIQQYYDANNEENFSKLDSLYSYPLKKFFVLKNVNRDIVYERTKFDWRHHDFPPFQVTQYNTSIAWDLTDSVKVLTRIGAQKKTKDLIMCCIKLDKNLKIYFVNTYLTQPKEEEITFIDSSSRHLR